MANAKRAKSKNGRRGVARVKRLERRSGEAIDLLKALRVFLASQRKKGLTPDVIIREAQRRYKDHWLWIKAGFHIDDD